MTRMKRHDLPIPEECRHPENPVTWAHFQSFYLDKSNSRLRMTPVMPADRMPYETIEVSPEDVEELRFLLYQELQYPA